MSHSDPTFNKINESPMPVVPTNKSMMSIISSSTYEWSLLPDNK